MQPDKPTAVPAAGSDRRGDRDRRHRFWWSIMYGSFNPRRRSPPRRRTETRFHSLDWHSAHLLGAAVGILLLNVADALMTVTLLSGGADEVNPVMAAFIYRSAGLFAAAKMALTSVGVVVMVILARHRFMRMVRVDVVLYAVLLGYMALLTYEFSLLIAALEHHQL